MKSCSIFKSLSILLLLFTGCSEPVNSNVKEQNGEIKSTYQLKSPDGRLVANVEIGKNMTYDVFYEGTQLIEHSSIALILGRGIVWGDNVQLQNAKEEFVDRSIDAPFYQQKKVSDCYNRLYLNCGSSFDVEFRAYDEGLAYRFISKHEGDYYIYGEEANFKLINEKQIYAAYAAHGNFNKTDKFSSNFEEMYIQTSVNGMRTDKLTMAPLLVDYGDKKLVIAESDVHNYPGMFLKPSETKEHTICGTFATYPTQVTPENTTFYKVVYGNEYIASCKGERTFPWRILCVAGNDGDLLTNHMVYRLSTPSKIDNTSWIKPGLAAWNYWSNHKNLSSMTFEQHKQFIDFAATYGMAYYVMDAGWADGSFNPTAISRLEELIAYGKQKNIGIFLWAGCAGFTGNQMESYCQRYSQMGIKGFKIDFWEYNNQPLLELMEKTAATMAKYKLMVFFHGCPNPVGLERTYPNIISYEAIKGMEYASTGDVGDPITPYDMVGYNVTFPFIRQIAGPSDYTPGCTKNIAIGSYTWAAKASEGTRCQQAALFNIIFSPIGMLCENPQNYNASEENRHFAVFIGRTPTVWDETRVITARLGDHIVMARRSGDKWFVAGINNRNVQTVSVPLSFLGGEEWELEMMSDAADAGTNQEHYDYVTQPVSNTTTLSIKMVAGGGFAAYIYKK